MGAGKQEAPPVAGDGGADGAEPPQPVVLGMVLHCAGCAKKVRKSIHHMPGVVSVVADPAANTVVVAGTADAAALKARIESKTKKPVQILSAGGAGNSKPPPATEPKKPTPPDKQQGGGEEEKKNPDKGDKAAGSSQPAEPKEGKKQPPEEKKPIEETPTPTPTTALLRIRLHCDSCADRIRRRIYKIKGVKDVVLEGVGKDEVKVVGTMDVPAMVTYLNDKLNRPVELAAAAAAPGSKDTKAKGGDDGHVMKDKGLGDGRHKAADKGKGIEVAGPSVASAAASMAAPTGASTHHVSPYGYAHVAYPPPQQQGPPPAYYGGGNAGEGGARYANAGGYYHQPRGDAGGYYQQQPSSDAGGFYQQQRSADAGGGYYQQQSRGTGGYYDQPSGGSYYPGGYEQHPSNPPPYQQPYSSAYGFDTAPPTQMFSDENPESCSIM